LVNRQQAAQPIREPVNPYPNSDLALTDPDKYQTQLIAAMQAQNQQTMAAYAAPVYQQLSETAKELSRSDNKNKHVWDKWGSEVERNVANVPLHQRTKELYDKAVVMVKGEHADELAAEAVSRISAANADTARSNSALGSGDMDTGSSDVWSRIEKSAMGKAAMQVSGKKGVLNAIQNGAYKSLEEFATMAEKSKARIDPMNPSIIYNNG